jgi:hypothetical protein
LVSEKDLRQPRKETWALAWESVQGWELLTAVRESMWAEGIYNRAPMALLSPLFLISL